MILIEHSESTACVPGRVVNLHLRQQTAINYDATITKMLPHHDPSAARAHNIID